MVETLDLKRVSDRLRELAKYRPARQVTDHLENERRRRRQLMWVGIPAQLIFFGVGLAYPNSSYALIALIPLAMLLRLFFLKTLIVASDPDKPIEPFLNAAAAFRVQRRVRNGITGDRVRVLLRERYRHVRWPFCVLIFEQRWKQTNDQFFLIISPEFHWWSGGSIWFPWSWRPGQNRELEFSKTTIGSTDKKFCIKFKFPEGLDWTLSFKSESAREQAHQALVAIRKLDNSSAAEQNPAREKAENKKAKENSTHSQSRKAADAEQLNDVVQKFWYEVLGVNPDASIQEITTAYRGAIKKCHPDTVADRSELIRQAAADEAKQINMAYRDARILRGF